MRRLPFQAASGENVPKLAGHHPQSSCKRMFFTFDSLYLDIGMAPLPYSLDVSYCDLLLTYGRQNRTHAPPGGARALQRIRHTDTDSTVQLLNQKATPAKIGDTGKNFLRI
jgi:hypothetical protein